MKRLSVMLMALLIGAVGVLAQEAQVRSLASGQKYKIEGTVVAKDDDQTFIVRDITGNDTRVVIAPEASVKTSGGFFGGGDRIASPSRRNELPMPHGFDCDTVEAAESARAGARGR